jgi:hypothetical protein
MYHLGKNLWDFFAMLTNKRDAARRKVLSILPRPALETLSRHERPWTLTMPHLLSACVEQWDETAVRAALEKILVRTRDGKPDGKPARRRAQAA